jgi:hypothetical protein
MRDLIWTIIFLWLFWKIFDFIKFTFRENQSKQKAYGTTKINKIQNKQKPRINLKDIESIDYEELS